MLAPHPRRRAGAGTVCCWTQAGVDARLQAEGLVHDGFELSFDGGRYRIDLQALTGKTVIVYGQTEVTRDLMDAREARGSTRSTRPRTSRCTISTATRPSVTYRPRTAPRSGSTATSSPAATAFTASAARAFRAASMQTYERVYPFGWLGILADVPPCRTN